MKIVLPFPPSVNGLFAHNKQNAKKRFKSMRYEKWLQICGDLEGLQLPEPCTISYLIFFPDDRERDGQNYMKATLDFLVDQGALSGDNRKIVKGEQWFDGGIDREKPRIEITVKEYRG